MTTDINKAATLLHIVEKASQSPALKNLRNLALSDLVEMDEDAEEELAERAKKAAEEAAAAKAKADKEAAKEAAAKVSHEPHPSEGEAPTGNMTRRSL